MTHIRQVPVQPITPASAPGRVRRVDADEPRGQSRQDPSHQPATEDHSAETGGGLSPAYAEVLVDPHTDALVIRIRSGASNTLLEELDAPELDRLSHQLRTYSAMLARRALTRARTLDRGA